MGPPFTRLKINVDVDVGTASRQQDLDGDFLANSTTASSFTSANQSQNSTEGNDKCTNTDSTQVFLIDKKSCIT